MQHDIRLRRIREKLIEKAKVRELIEYGYFINGDYGVARGQGAPWQIGTVLGEICASEYREGRPLLSAICVLATTRMPSSGFWDWDVEFIPEFVRNGTEAQRREFWEPVRDEVFDYWQRHDP
ncbi:MAG: hypothetical protein KAV68_06650 [Dehalococcoidales bacterium]|nr:hypothetical protein [Dehalococcoidales bacterium]